MLFFRYENVDMSIAVATDNGLITPIVTQADARVSLSTSLALALAKVSLPL